MQPLDRLQLAAPYLGISAAESAALVDLLPSDPHAAPTPSHGVPFGARVAAWVSAACDVRATFAYVSSGLRKLWDTRSLKLMLLGRGTLYVVNFGVILVVALGETCCQQRFCPDLGARPLLHSQPILLASLSCWVYSRACR